MIKRKIFSQEYRAIPIICAVIIGISIANYKNFTFRGLIIGLAASFVIIAAISWFCIYTKIGRKLDKNKTKDIHDKLSSPQ
jgi:uncharacterized membrane protein